MFIFKVYIEVLTVPKTFYSYSNYYTMAELTLPEFWLTCPKYASDALITQSSHAN